MYILEAKNVKTKNPYYEEVFNNLASLGVELPYSIISESAWNEIDNQDDYIEATHKFNSW